MGFSFAIPSLLDELHLWSGNPGKELPELLEARLLAATPLFVAVNLAGYVLDAAVWRHTDVTVDGEAVHYVVPSLSRRTARVFFDADHPFPGGCALIPGPALSGQFPPDAQEVLALHLRPRGLEPGKYAIELTSSTLALAQDPEIDVGGIDDDGAVWIAIHQRATDYDGYIVGKLHDIALAICQDLLVAARSVLGTDAQAFGKAWEAWLIKPQAPLGLLPMFDPRTWGDVPVTQSFVTDANVCFSGIKSDALVGLERFLTGQVVSAKGEYVDRTLELGEHFKLAQALVAVSPLPTDLNARQEAVEEPLRKGRRAAQSFAAAGLAGGEARALGGQRVSVAVMADVEKRTLFWLLAALDTLECVDVLPVPPLPSTPEFPPPGRDVTGFYVEDFNWDELEYGVPGLGNLRKNGPLYPLSESFEPAPAFGDSRSTNGKFVRSTLQLNQAGRWISGHLQTHVEHVINDTDNDFGRTITDGTIEGMLAGRPSETATTWGTDATLVVRTEGLTETFAPTFRLEHGVLSLELSSTTSENRLIFTRVSTQSHVSDEALAVIPPEQRRLLHAFQRRPMDHVELFTLWRLILHLKVEMSIFFPASTVARGESSGRLTVLLSRGLRRYEGDTKFRGPSSQTPVIQATFRLLARRTMHTIGADTRSIWGWIMAWMQQSRDWYPNTATLLGLSPLELRKTYQYRWAIEELDFKSLIKVQKDYSKYFYPKAVIDFGEDIAEGLNSYKKLGSKFDFVQDGLERAKLSTSFAEPRKLGGFDVTFTFGHFHIEHVGEHPWKQDYYIALLGGSYGLSGGAALGGEDSDKEIEALEQWGPDSFEGPVLFAGVQWGKHPFQAFPAYVREKIAAAIERAKPDGLELREGISEYVGGIVEWLQTLQGYGFVIFIGNGHLPPTIGYTHGPNTVYGTYVGLDASMKLGYLWRADRAGLPDAVRDGTWLGPRVDMATLAGGVMNAFAVDSATLTEPAWQELRRLCAEHRALLANPASDLEIVGFASPTGDARMNKRLSEARARATLQAMRDILGPEVFALTSVGVYGVGEDAAVAAGVPHDQEAAEWRRVEIRMEGRLVGQLVF